VRDDVVEHLAAIDKLEEHVPVVVCANDIAHATDVGVAEQTDNGSLSGGADLLGVVGALTVGGALVLVLGQPGDYLDGNLLSRLAVFCQLDLAHTSSADCLAQRPCSCAGGCDGSAPFGDGYGLGGTGAVGGGTVGRHCAHGRGVRSIARMAASGGLCARGSGVAGFAVTGGRVGGDVGLLVVAAGGVLEGVGVGVGSCGSALGAGWTVGGMSRLLRPARSGRVANNGGRRGGCG
jgi:hypothetical protein